MVKLNDSEEMVSQMVMYIYGIIFNITTSYGNAFNITTLYGNAFNIITLYGNEFNSRYTTINDLFVKQ